ncbi:MAG TPA: adenylate/guanylate cyclase domain-containing protein [Kiloniellaceae bacterium]|nr:adenylate/guanylate cyclase domain-containing protein [Kiloniellaceae bacterium]
MTLADPGRDSLQAAELQPQARLKAQPVIDWLTDMGMRRSRITMLHDGFIRQLISIGIPIDRSTLHLPQLHPQMRAVTVLWEAEAGGAMEIPRAHGVEQTDFFMASPVRLVNEGGPAIRRRLCEPDCPIDFPIVQDLQAAGFRDYTARPLPFSNKQMNTVTFASKSESGFDDLDIATIDACLPAFATVLELRNVYRTARTLLQTYIGARTSDRVLSGTVKRGDVEQISAVLLCSDVRGFTALSENLPMQEIVELLDEYFEIMGTAIVDTGGEVLKFIGDGLLAIYPTDHAGEAATDSACAAAMDAAQQALENIGKLQERRRAGGLQTYEIGIALHVGEVMYGNIGAADRLDFTVIGPAVNLVSRIEGLNSTLGLSLIYSAAFAAHWGGGSRSLGVHALKGIAEAQEVFTLADPPA